MSVEDKSKNGGTSDTPNSPTETTEKETGFNQGHFAIIYGLITIVLIVVAFKYFDPESGSKFGSAFRISVLGMQSVGLWLLTAVGFAAALNGLNCNVYREIIKEHNIALALLIGLAWLSMAIVIHG